ncbi:hypothetical protein KAK07_11910 [Ideonella sp. 4Y16]|uniref:hypothetical protein n=1 Tax=Ideonella alba TaxID=2824118 RepID=UPI001B360496|nr:hypothetical protein [Ideonella alba]MBQ0944040.1 hypothetical protein [Ideonella alba]
MQLALTFPTRPTVLAAALAALLISSATLSTAADAPTGQTPTLAAGAAAILADLHAGRLQAAEIALRGWAIATPADAERRQRLQGLVQQQRQRAAMLLDRAAVDLRHRRLPAAVERTEAALTLDSGLAQHPGAAVLLAARSRLWQARDAVRDCVRARDAVCMDRAMRDARALAPQDSAVALLALQATGWWVAGQPHAAMPVEGTTSSR